MTLRVITHYSMPIVRYCGKTVSRKGSAMVPSERAVATSYRLSIVTMGPSAASCLAAILNGMSKGIS